MVSEVTNQIQTGLLYYVLSILYTKTNKHLINMTLN